MDKEGWYPEQARKLKEKRTFERFKTEFIRFVRTDLGIPKSLLSDEAINENMNKAMELAKKEEK
jgi:hypothetical protein